MILKMINVNMNLNFKEENKVLKIIQDKIFKDLIQVKKLKVKFIMVF